MRRSVRGAGGKGGGGGGRSPREASDSLRSIQYARVLDLVSEGEISGLVNGEQSIFLDDTPVKNGDGTYNFQGLTISARNGTQAQTYVEGFPAVEAEIPVATEVVFATPVTRTVNNSNVNRVRLTIGTPQLTAQDTATGDLLGWVVQFAIDVQSNGGGFVEQALPDVGVFRGKTTSRYQRSYEIALAGAAPWDIRVRRVSVDSGAVTHQNRTFWDSFTEIIDAKLSYPNSALVSLEVDASQFNNVPRRGFEAKGLLLDIPSNYDPIARTYTGVWDGTFVTAWTDNPAWCFYGLLTNERWGIGAYVDADQVDKWALYSIAEYCDELVPDGFGGEEPRFTCNLYLQTREEAFRVVTGMASIFRGMAYWAAGAVVPVADMPSDAVALFAAANIVGGQFSYQGSAKNTRHTVALVTWNDPADAYRQKVEYVEDLAGIERYGIVQTEILAFGCTSRGQAHRLGKWLLYSERLETETVTFRAGLDGVLVSPGDVITTQDAARSGMRFGGRVGVGATTGAVPIDNAVTIVSGNTYTLSTVSPDGTIATAPVTNAPGSTSTLTVSPALSAAPQANAIWVLSATDLVPETWRVIAVTEVEKSQYEVVALKHNPDKYDAVEENLLLEPPPTSSIQATPPSPTNLVVSESLFESGPGVVSNRATVSWTGTTGRYRLMWRGLTSNWTSLDTISQTVNLDALTPDTYTFNVWQLNALGIQSTLPATLTHEIYGKTAPPEDVTGFTVIKASGVALASWDLHPALDVRVGGRIEVRHEAVTSGAVWNNGVMMHAFDGNAITGTLPLITGTYLAKALDSTGHYSESAVGFVLTEGMVTGFTIVGTQTEDPTFAGTKVNCAVVGSSLRLSTGLLFDSAAGNFDDATGMFDGFGGQATEATYTFGPLDLTTVATRRFEADIELAAFNNGDTFDEHQGDFDSADGEFDGDDSAINDGRVVLYARLTDDDPGASPTWGEWFPFLVSDFTCRGAEFRLNMDVDTPANNIDVSALTVHAKEPA